MRRQKGEQMISTGTEKVRLYGVLLARIWDPPCEVLHKETADRSPYRWEIRTRSEPPDHVTTVAFTSDDVLAMNQKKSDEQRIEYLEKRFGKPSQGIEKL